MVRRRSNKTNRRIRSKNSIRKTRKTRKTKRVKSKKRSKLHGGANAGNLNEDEAKKYIKTLLGMSELFPDEISVYMISKVRVNEEKTIKEILDILNKNNKDKKVYSVEDLYDETIAYVKSYNE